MRSKMISAVALAAVLALTGCGSDDSASNSTPDANADVCTQFAATHNELTELTLGGPVGAGEVGKWTADKDATISKFAPLAEQASGAVREGLQALVTTLPTDSLELTEPDSASGQAFVDNSVAVASACEADGTEITLTEFPLQKF
ncbi:MULTISPECIES: hypothetical protein [unclassified Rhodococcus (in: high G+C Gram-positive bacteria)]|uniref:hypothetical protein n=1 Tax=unclassified Rhodococcus (in: high G+C Gram-positive bacteria) TaxID=192944 RepID=UPI0033993B88